MLGREGAVEFFLTFGGSAMYFAPRPQAGSMLANKIGLEAARQLGERLGPATVRVPTAKPFIAAEMRAMNASVADIARRLHVSDVTVRRMLKFSEPASLPLFE